MRSIEIWCNGCNKKIFGFVFKSERENKIRNTRLMENAEFLNILKENNAGLWKYPQSIGNGRDSKKTTATFHKDCLRSAWEKFKELSETMPHREAILNVV